MQAAAERTRTAKRQHQRNHQSDDILVADLESRLEDFWARSGAQEFPTHAPADKASVDELLKNYRLPTRMVQPQKDVPKSERFPEPVIVEQHFDLPMTLEEVRQMQSDRWLFFKIRRLLDIGTALAILVPSLPLMAVIAVAVRLDSSGPAFFGHWRLGREGVPFRCWKFRSMHLDADERLEELLTTDRAFRAEWIRDQKAHNDPRVTGLGEFLRRTKLDELPQLFNVLRGQMSIIGPRPITEGERPRYGNAMDLVLTIRPGMTGPWQTLQGSQPAFQSRVRNDYEFVSRLTAVADARVLSATIVMLFGAKRV